MTKATPSFSATLFLSLGAYSSSPLTDSSFSPAPPGSGAGPPWYWPASPSQSHRAPSWRRWAPRSWYSSESLPSTFARIFALEVSLGNHPWCLPGSSSLASSGLSLLAWPGTLPSVSPSLSSCPWRRPAWVLAISVAPVFSLGATRRVVALLRRCSLCSGPACNCR